MKRSELLKLDKEKFNKEVDNYIENCELIKKRVNNINENEISNSEDTLLTSSIYATNNRISSSIDSTIQKVLTEKANVNSKLDEKIAQALEQERQELLKKDDSPLEEEV